MGGYLPTGKTWYENLVGTPEFEEMGPTFKRMWKYYLIGGAASAACRKISVWQLVWTKFPNESSTNTHHVRIQPELLAPKDAPAKAWYNTSRFTEDSMAQPEGQTVTLAGGIKVTALPRRDAARENENSDVESEEALI